MDLLLLSSNFFAISSEIFFDNSSSYEWIFIT